MELTNSYFHTARSLSIRAETFSLYIRGFIGVKTLYVSGLGIHLSLHIFTLSPFPIDHLIPSSTMLLAAKMLRQAKDGLLPSWASRKDLLAKYVAWKTWWKREFVFWRRRQPCLARRARLKAFRSLNLMPPISLDLHNLSQEIEEIFRSSNFCPHQNLLIIELSSLQSESGNLKQLMVYVGVAWATALMRTSLPAEDNNFPFQPAIFWPSWSLILLKAFFFLWPIKDGRPRYLSCCLMTWAPKNYWFQLE